MKYKRMPIEIESPEQIGYDKIECNLTESSFSDMILDDMKLDLKGLLLCYGDHMGKLGFRKTISEEFVGLTADDVLLTPGAAAALFIISTSLLEAGDELLVMCPNYATNIETPRAINAKIEFLNLKFENGFKFPMNEFLSKLNSNTKLVSLTTPHNPTGVTLSETELHEIVNAIEKANAYLVLDETYRDMNFTAQTKLGALWSQRVITVSSLSKTYGIPGIRLGWILTKNKRLMETFLAAKEQIVITNSVVDEEIGHQYYLQRSKYLPKIREKINLHTSLVQEWIAHENRIEWVKPVCGVACFPRIKESVKVDLNKFYKTLNEEFKTHVGSGHWFEMDKRYFRIGFGWPKTEELKKGLLAISKSLDLSVNQ